MTVSTTLSSLSGINHRFFDRSGGFSRGIYNGLNCGLGSDDERETVLKNRAKVTSQLGIPADGLLTVFQYHSAVAVTVTEPWKPEEAPEADAMVTNKPGIGLGILTADCVPVLFADEQNGVIGAAHAGWRGAVGGILESTIDSMEQAGAVRDQVHACIGPCIRQESYEVGQDMHDRILDLDSHNADFFTLGNRDGHYQFDLAGYVCRRLQTAGVAHTDDVLQDTYANEEAFYSFRRTTHREEPDYGRQISVITLTPTQ